MATFNDDTEETKNVPQVTQLQLAEIQAAQTAISADLNPQVQITSEPESISLFSKPDEKAAFDEDDVFEEAFGKNVIEQQ